MVTRLDDGCNFLTILKSCGTTPGCKVDDVVYVPTVKFVGSPAASPALQSFDRSCADDVLHGSILIIAAVFAVSVTSEGINNNSGYDPPPSPDISLTVYPLLHLTSASYHSTSKSSKFET